MEAREIVHIIYS